MHYFINLAFLMPLFDVANIYFLSFPAFLILGWVTAVRKGIIGIQQRAF